MITYTLLDCLFFFSINKFIFYLYYGSDDCPKKVSSSSKDSGFSLVGD